MTSPCPKCGYRREPADTAPDWQCPSRGIAYAKYRPRTEERPQSQVTPSGENRGSVRSFNEVVLICVGITAVMLLFRGMRGSISVLHAAPLVPFFLCLVSAVSSVLGEGLYYWNRWKMSFELFDGDAHPILFRLQQCFFIVCTIIFAAYFFKLRH